MKRFRRNQENMYHIVDRLAKKEPNTKVHAFNIITENLYVSLLYHATGKVCIKSSEIQYCTLLSYEVTNTPEEGRYLLWH